MEVERGPFTILFIGPSVGFQANLGEGIFVRTVRASGVDRFRKRRDQSFISTNGSTGYPLMGLASLGTLLKPRPDSSLEVGWQAFRVWCSVKAKAFHAPYLTGDCPVL